MDTLVIYCKNKSNRLQYVLDWLLGERLQLKYILTDNENVLLDKKAHILYGSGIAIDCITIPDIGLLWQTGIHNVEPLCISDLDTIPVLFKVDGIYEISFDLFSAIFYLISRYEEYLPYTPDKHNRYPANDSILYKNAILKIPIIDLWVTDIKKRLEIKFNIDLPESKFNFLPTYDIDIAFSHLHKGIARIAGAYLRAILKGDIKQIDERIQILNNKQKDPYDSFHWLHQLHIENDIAPIYFILCAMKTTTYDKNLHPLHPAMLRIIKNLSKEGKIGIHPSYFYDRNEIIVKEKKILEEILTHSVAISRQHYIKINVPLTYRLLIKNNIQEDYSMGYGTHIGFRAGTGSSFLWYDIEKEAITPLRIFPFCFMDTTAHFEENLSVEQAFHQLKEMQKFLQQNNSTLITIFHNFSLGTSNLWLGWQNAYASFIDDIITKN